MRRRLRSAAFLTTAALGLTACAGGSTGVVDGFDAKSMLAAASSRADAAGTARVHAVMEMTVDGQDFTMEFDGEQDLRSGAVRMRMDLADAMSQAGPIPDGMDTTMETLMVPPRMYMRGAFSSMLGTDGWILIDMSRALGVDMSAFTGAAQPQDFSSYLDSLQGASDDVEVLGREDIRGVSTTRIRATIDPKKALDALEGDDRQAFEDLLASQPLPDSYPMQVWIDDDGLPRQIEMAVTMDQDGTSIDMRMTMEFYDFGADLDLDEPTDFVDMTDELAPMMGG